MHSAQFNIGPALLVALATTVGLADVVTVETLGWSGTGMTNGWRHVSLGAPFSDGAAQFKDGSRIASPRWDEFDILRVDVRLRCSTDAPNRWLQMSFLRNGKVVAEQRRFESVFRAEKAEMQSVPVAREKQTNDIVPELSEGVSGDWGVYAISVAAAATTRKMAGFAVTIR